MAEPEARGSRRMTADEAPVPQPSRCLYALADHHSQLQRQHGKPGRPWRPTGYVFGTRYGTPLEPRNLTRMFGQLLTEHNFPAGSAARPE